MPGLWRGRRFADPRSRCPPPNETPVRGNQTNPNLAGNPRESGDRTKQRSRWPSRRSTGPPSRWRMSNKRRLRKPNKPKARRNPRDFDHRIQQANPARLLAGGISRSPALPAIGSPAAPRRISAPLPTHFLGSTAHITHREIKAAAASRAAAKHAEDTARPPLDRSFLSSPGRRRADQPARPRASTGHRSTSASPRTQ
jgi:hypothetical protein